MLRSFALTGLMVIAFLAASTAAESRWESVTSKEGQFTIALPGKVTIHETRTRKGPGGNVRTILLGCKGEAGVYLAYKILLPTAIVKGTEDEELDTERDEMAKDWNGKVIAERKIRAGDSVGRDITIRGRPEKALGTVTIRLREYLTGNSVYMVAVISVPNRELPDDSGQFLGSLAIGTAKVRAQGTPTPDPKGLAVRGWGEAIDPCKDCEFVAGGKSLKVNVTGSGHQLVTKQLASSLPRIVREVEGDFVISVKVAGDFRPGGKSTHPKNLPWNGAGILIWSDPDNFIRFERAAVNRMGRITPYVNFEEFEGSTVAASHNEGLQGGDCWVRVERKGSRLRGSISYDGTTWKNLKPIQTVYPTRLKVGLCASSSSGLPFSVAFEDFDLKTGKN